MNGNDLMKRVIFFFLLQGGIARDKQTRQLDREDTVLSGNQIDGVGSQYPLHPPTGERTRKTYDFTSMPFRINLIC